MSNESKPAAFEVNLDEYGLMVCSRCRNEAQVEAIVALRRAIALREGG